MDQTNWLVLVVMAIFLISICNGYRKGFFRLCVSLAATILTVILVGILTPYVGEAIMKWTTVDEAVQEKCTEIFTPAEISEKENVSLQEQIQTIEQAELPEFFKQILLENNNREIYEILGVEQFADYISGYITRTAINVMAFLVTFVLITIVVRMTLFTLDVITKIEPLGRSCPRACNGSYPRVDFLFGHHSARRYSIRSRVLPADTVQQIFVRII